MDTSSSNGKRAQEGGDVTTTSAKKQKLGERKPEMAGTGEEEQYLIPLRLTARSGYLAVEDVARLLLFTGKTFMGNIFGDLENDCPGRSSTTFARTSTMKAPFVEDNGPFRYVRNIEVTRNVQTKKFGLYMQSFAADQGNVGIGCIIAKTTPLMQSSAVIEDEDALVSINGKDVRGWTGKSVIQEMLAIHGNILSISIRRFRPDIKSQVWKCICQHKWRDSQALTRLMESIGKRCSSGEADWKGLFDKFFQKRKTRFKVDACDTYNFLVSVYDNAGASLDSAPVASLIIDDIHSSRLLTKGESKWIELESPINIGSFSCSMDIRREMRRWSVGLHAIRKMDKKTRKIDLQPLDAKYILRSNKIDRDEGTKKWRCFTRKRGPFKGVIVCGDLTNLITNGRIHSKADIEFKRDLRCCIVKHDDGKKECVIDAISVSALIKVESMGERERTRFSENDKVKSSVTLAKFLARADGWE